MLLLSWHLGVSNGILWLLDYTIQISILVWHFGCCKCNFDNSGDSFIFNEKWTKGAFSSCDIYLWWIEFSKKALRASLDIFWSFTLFFSSLAVKYHHVQLRNQSTKGIIIFHCPNFKHWKYSKVFVDVLGTFNSFQPYPKLLQLSHSALFYDIRHTTYNTWTLCGQKS